MIRSGFFNATNHDKQYYASDISRLFNALVNDGIFENIGNHFSPRPGSGMQVIIGSGMSYINSTWTLNDSDHVVNIDEAPYVSGFSRIDGIFIKSYAETNITTRENEIFYMKGTETSDTPTAPVPEKTEDEIYTPLCYVTVANGDTEITAASIRNVIGLSDSPYITGILQTVDISELFNQWSAEWNTWTGMKKRNFDTWSEGMMNEFITWFNQIKGILSEDAAGNLQNEIDSFNATIASIRSQQTSQNTKITALEDAMQDVENKWDDIEWITNISTSNPIITRYRDGHGERDTYLYECFYDFLCHDDEELIFTLTGDYSKGENSDTPGYILYDIKKMPAVPGRYRALQIVFHSMIDITLTIILRISDGTVTFKTERYIQQSAGNYPEDMRITIWRREKYKPAD